MRNRADVFFLVLVFGTMLWGGCNSKRLGGQTQPYDFSAITEYIHLTDTFDFLILHYVPWYGCDTLEGVSETIGIMQPINDTIIVLSLNNCDTFFKEGMTVEVAPHEKPDIDTLRMGSRTLLQDREYVYPELYKKQMKTTYGDLLK